MSQDESTNDHASFSTTDPDASSEEDVSPKTETTQEMHEVLGELRAEVTRLKAQRAKKRAKSWVQRRPFLAVTLASLVGAAAGYGAAAASRRGPPTLSEQARRRLRRLADEARHVATDVGKGLSDRAARSGQEIRERAQKAGERWAKQARQQGEGAQEWARRTSERAQRLGSEAGQNLRRKTEEASEEARELGKTLAEEAEGVVEEQAESVREAVSATEGSSRLRRSLLTITGLAAGGYLASKVRRWF